MASWPDWIYRQSAALPYRGEGNDLEVLLITSRKGHRWLPPKGIVEPGMTAPQSAAKEAFEEAGVRGEISGQGLGCYLQRKWRGICEIEVFPMKVTEELTDWLEAGTRQREWLPISQAAKRVEDETLRKIIRRLPGTLAGTTESDRHPLQADRPSPRLIYLLRHAKSSWDDPNLEDSDRPLARRGRRAVKTMRRYMAFADIRPELVLCSDSLRTRATLEGLRLALGDVVPVSCDPNVYHGDWSTLMSRLQRLPADLTSVMMVGHNPGLQSLVLALCGSGDDDALGRLRSKFPTGGLATLVFRGEKWGDLGPGGCELHSFVAPRHLE